MKITSHVRFPICVIKYIADNTRCTIEVLELERFKTAKMTSKVIQRHWQWCHSIVTHDFLLAYHCNYVSISHRFRDTITYFSKFKEVT